jgi:hypothetical protein
MEIDKINKKIEQYLIEPIYKNSMHMCFQRS